MFLSTHTNWYPIPVRAAMLRADLQQGDSADQREGPAGEGAALAPLQDSDVVRDGETYYLVINNLGERCLLFVARFTG